MIGALLKLHTTGFVHNDIKPDNICFGNYGLSESNHELKIIDFGCATKFRVNGKHI